MRIGELANLDFEDVEEDGGKYLVNIRQSKTDQAGSGYQFIISPAAVSDICPCRHISHYMELFENRTGRFFRRIGKNGKPSVQPIGVNSLGKFPQMMADFLQLEGNFTGHAFRRSSATILADRGANLVQLKRLGRWRSSSVAEAYVDRSKKSKSEASMLINGQNAAVEGVEQVRGCSFNNCVVTFNFTPK